MPCASPSNPPTGTCSYTEGQFLFTTSWGESVYAHFYNGVLFAAYRDGSGFKPQHWLVDTGQMTSSNASCFAENDPHTTTNPSTGNNFAGNLDGADCNGISGWVVNRNAPTQSMRFDIYINGWLAASAVPATQNRQDVANALGISGYNAFGFNVGIPNNYKVGVPLVVSVKYYGTQTDIPGSPKTTTTCGTSNSPYGVYGFDPECRPGIERVIPGSGQSRSARVARTGTISLELSTKGSKSISSLQSQLIPVKQGENILLDAYAFTPAIVKPSLNPQLTMAAAGGLIAGLALTQNRGIAPDHGRSIQSIPTLGLSTAMMLPLVKRLLDNHLPRATVELAYYNNQGKFVHRQLASINETARGSWQLLHIDGHAPQDGYMVLRLQNRSRTPVYFDDLSFQTNFDQTVFFSKIIHSHNGFAPQTNIDEKSLYDVTSANECVGKGPGSGTPFTFSGVNYIDLGTTVKAAAPKYKDVDDIPVIKSSNPIVGGGGSSGSSSSFYVRSSTDEALRIIAQTKAIRMTICAGLNNLWNWSYSNNDPNTTKEMAGFELADGTFLSIPWDGNSNDKSYFKYNTPWVDNTGVYEYKFVQNEAHNGYVIQQRELLPNLFPNGEQHPVYKDIPVVSYVHTHPYSDGSHDTYNPTRIDPEGKQPYADWQMSADYGIPGKIITPDKTLNFHFNPQGKTKDEKQVVDPSESRQPCSEQN